MTLAFLGLLSPRASAQEQVPRDTLISVARGIMEEARYCGLATFDQSGRAQVRTMDPFLPESDMTIWMGTHRRSRKVEEIRNDPRVTLYYQSPDGAGYVTLFGRALIVEDPAEKASRWKAEWAAFYTDRDADYLLIQVTPERLEVLDYSRGIAGDPQTWTPPAVEFSGGGS
jgi:general stress protein 26